MHQYVVNDGLRMTVVASLVSEPSLDSDLLVLDSVATTTTK